VAIHVIRVRYLIRGYPCHPRRVFDLWISVPSASRIWSVDIRAIRVPYFDLWISV